MSNLLRFALHDLRGSGRALWVFVVCLILGVSLISASGGLYRVVQQALMAQTRVLLGGDAEVLSREPLSIPELTWLQERSDVSLLIQFRTMLTTPDGESQLVLLQGVDDAYPLYGSVRLNPDISLSDAIRAPLTVDADQPGITVDRVLADRLGLVLGQTVMLGAGRFKVAGLIEHQPDRGLNADWNGLPVIVSVGTLETSGLLKFGSRADYRYRVEVRGDVEQWRRDFLSAFPEGRSEVRTFEDRNARLGEVLSQIGSGILLIGLSSLLIGSLGVYNSVSAYLGLKLRTIATLGAIGLRDRGIRFVYGFQLLLLASICAALGSVLGSGLALIGLKILQRQLPVAMSWDGLLIPLLLAWCLGITVAMTFAWPALARALTVSSADLFRSDVRTGKIRKRDWFTTALLAALSVGLMLALLPDVRFGAIYLLAILAVFVSLEVMVRFIRGLARQVVSGNLLNGKFTWRLAVSSLERRDSPLRPLLLTLGAALTLVVTSTLVVVALFVTITQTVPQSVPALVFYDVSETDRAAFTGAVTQASGVSSLELMPLVLGRVSAVNGQALGDAQDVAAQMASRDEHKLSTWRESFDEVVVVRGALWDKGYAGDPLLAMEDREADQLGLQIGDMVQFDILGQPLNARLVAVYAQKRLQSRLWLEGMFSQGALDPFVTRYVGMAFVDPQSVVRVQNDVAREFPAVVTVRTDILLAQARSILRSAGIALAMTGMISLLASVLVLLSVMSAFRIQQAHVMTILHTVGARVSVLRNALLLEYLLVAAVLTLFSATAGAAIGSYLLHVRIGILEPIRLESGFFVAAGLCLLVLGIGVLYLQRQFRFSPASLLRSSADG